MGRAHGEIHWSELITSDAKAAAEYFRKVVGWSIQEWKMGEGEPYRVCMVGEQPVGGIMQRRPEMGDAPSQWMTYIAVKDVDAAAKAAAKHGGKLVQPPFDVPEVGRIAMIQDPTGATVGLITPA